MKLYGIPNCSTVKKARDWLASHDIKLEFHDFKKQGVDSTRAAGWLKQAGWEAILNRKGLTWRGLPDSRKILVDSDETALELLLEKPSVIKRPLLEINGKLVHIGFDIAAYSKIFKL